MSRVREILERKGDDVLTVTPETTVFRAAQRMRAAYVGALVVSADGRRLDGIVTERDIVFGLAREGVGILERPVAALMTRAPVTCSLDDPVRSVMATMTRTRERHVPVVEAGLVRGIVSIGDMVKACLDDADLEAAVMRDAYLAQRSRLASG